MSQPNRDLMMNLTARMPSVVSSSTSSNPGRTSYGYQDPGKSVASDDRSGNLRNRHHHQDIQKRIMVNLGLLRSGKSGAAAHDRSGKPEKTSWDIMQQVALIVKNLFSTIGLARLSQALWGFGPSLWMLLFLMFWICPKVCGLQ